MKNKSGISLTVLVITLVVISILTGIIINNSFNSIDSSKKTAFAEELKTVLEAANEYYLNKGVYPISEEYTKSEVINMATTDANRNKLQNEMTLNGDTDTVYYGINLELISIGGGIFDQYESNTYVINSTATDIYYPKGIEIGDETYFSLSSKLININKENSTDENLDNLTVNNMTSSIKATKSTDEITNNLNITIDTALNLESLYYTVGGVETQITGSIPYIITLSKDILTAEQIAAIKEDKKIYFTKKVSGNVVANSNLDISNLDVSKPVFTSNPTVETYDMHNLVKFIDIVQDENEIFASYYTSSTSALTGEQIVSEGVKSDANYIRLDKAITSIQMVVVDVAGNISEVVNVTI